MVPALMFALSSILSALNLPLYVSVATDNHLDWYPNREVKTISWDEKYLFALGLDNLRKGDLALDLRLTSAPDFTQQQVLIDRIDASLHVRNFVLTATTRAQGIGKGYHFQNQYVSSAFYDQFLYAQTRFNGLQVKHRGKLESLLALGGNVHNQAMASAGINCLKDSSLSWGLSVDASARDTHWNTPQVMPSLLIGFRYAGLHLRSDLAYKHIFPWDGNSLKQEYFASGEALFDTRSLPNLILSATYLFQDHAPKRQLRLQAALEQAWGRFTISPSYSHLESDEEALNRFNTLIAWNFHSENRVSVYYQYDGQTQNQARHSFGVQSSLRLDF